MTAAIAIGHYFRIPLAEIEFTYARSSGPGGQNVNKVNSKCLLRWNAQASASIPAWIRERVLARLQSRLTSEGDLLIASDEHRDRLRNQDACMERLQAILLDAATPPKIRRDTKPTKGSQRRRFEAKKRLGAKKGMRGKVGRDD